MSEFIGARISLISKSDIRYVGTLIEINSEDSTVALENVTSFGTEGRRVNPADEVAPSDSVYEYIVFRGSDVKDLRIEEPPKENDPPKPPQVPNDPAILGTGSRPQPHNSRPQQTHQGANGFPQPPQYPPFPQQHYNQFPQQRFPGGPQHGFQGPPNGFQGYPGPYGPPPPGWYPPPGQGFPHPPGPFGAPSQQQHYGLPGQQPAMQPPQQAQKTTDQTPTGSVAQELESSTQPKSKVDDTPAPIPSRGNDLKSFTDSNKGLPSAAMAPRPPTSANTVPPNAAAAAPRPPVETKPDVASALAAPAPNEQSLTASKMPPTGPRSGRIVPAIPLASPASKNIAKIASAQAGPEASASPNTSQNQALQYQNSTQAATAAVAAAMAKLPPAAGQKFKQSNEGDAMDNLTRKVNEMRTDDRIRHGRQPGTGGFANRGSRGAPRRGGREQGSRPTEVPTADFDFESANAKFNKHDVVKEAIATGSPTGTPTDGEVPDFNGAETVQDTSSVTSPPMYTKSSFFDNISSEARDREDAAEGKRAPGVQEFRSEERRRNFETFGQGSVDNGYRGGLRGRGRGRGGFRGGRGAFTGGYRGARGAYRGGQDGANGAQQDTAAA